MGVHMSVTGLYRAPVLSAVVVDESSPPQTIISVPVHTAAWFNRGLGAPVVLTVVQVSVVGL
jgi:hypothetical protein